MDYSEIQNRLNEANRTHDEITALLKSVEWEILKPKWVASSAKVLEIERELAAAKSEQYAMPLDFPVRWGIGAPLPHIIANEYRTLLLFYVRDTEFRSHNPDTLALVEFKMSRAFKLGDPNDEVHQGHPLFSRGLDWYSAQTVHNSIWLRELENINSVHEQYSPERWLLLNHYVFWFHDSTFECIAESFEVELLQEELAKALEIACRRLS